MEAATNNLIEPVLVGPTNDIKALADKLGLDISKYKIVEAETEAKPLLPASPSAALVKRRPS